MKKSLRFGLGLFAIFQILVLPFELSAQTFSDSFETGTYIPNWVMGTGPFTATVTTNNPEVGNYRLELRGNNDNGAHLNGLSHTLSSNIKPEELSWSIYPVGSGVAVSYFVIGDENMSATNCMLFSYFDSGNIKFAYGNTVNDVHLYPASTNTWYNIRITNINWTNHTFDIFINNVLFKSAVIFRSNTQNSLRKIHLYNFNNGTGIWDNIIIEPNNALAFDGVDDHLAIGNPLAAGSYTKEAWIYSTNNSGARNIISSDRNPFWISGGTLYAGNSGSFNAVQSTNMPINKWVHVAVTYEAGTSMMTLYQDGVQVDSKSGVPPYFSENMFIGSHRGGESFFQGKIDEVKIYNQALTATEILADWKSSLSARPSALRASYSFNQGFPAGDNTAITTLPDRSGNNNNGTLNNFAKTNGNTTSNFVGSYAMVVPTATTATVSPSNVTANWTAPTTGVVSNYQLNYSTDVTFATSNTVNSIPNTATSYVITNLKPGTGYYYRVSAVSGTEVGGYSNVIAATTTKLTPPGNALAFDGSLNNFVDLNTNPTSIAGNSWTLETWIKADPTSTNEGIYVVSNNNTSWDLGEKAFYLDADGTPTFVGNSSNFIRSSQPVNDGTWHHIAVSYNAATAERAVYVDGINTYKAAGSGYNNTQVDVGTAKIGRRNYLSSEAAKDFSGTLDQFRIWSVARTRSQIVDGMTLETPSDIVGLVSYYNFDQGVAKGSNAGITTLYDRFGNNDGILRNFALTGTVSNWVGSYAMVIPTATTATNASTTGFTANWTIPATVTANSFIVEYSPTPNFNSKVLTVTATTNSYTFTNLASETANFYYRVRAVGDPGISAVSNIVKVVLNPLTPAGNALAFDGSDHVAIENGPVLGDQFTQEAWILPQGNATFRAIIGGGSSTVNTATTRPPSMYVQNGTGLHGGFSDGVDWYTFNIANILTTNQWAHVAQSFDGNTLSVYVNGELIHSTAAYAGKHTQAVPVSKIGFINNYFLGSMDEVRVWNVTRTAQEIRDFYNKTLVGIPAGLVGYFRFNQGQANGNNTLITAAQNESGSKGLLVDFTKTGTVSNFVGSNNYPMEAATATTASSVTTNSFVANWSPTTSISSTTYYLDVASDVNFATLLSAYSNTNTGNVNSFEVTGLTPGSTYYYRVRAHSEFFGTAANSNSITVTGDKIDQAITLAATNTVVYGDADYALGATSTNSGVALTYNSSDPSIATVSTTGTVQILNAGAVKITVTQAGDAQYNAAATVTQNLIIIPKTIIATAEAKSKTYGDADPVLTYTFTPTLAFSDTFTGSVTRTTGENVGAYAIIQGDLALSDNYALTVVPATLTINSKAIVAIAEAKTKTYGDADPSLTYTITPTLAFSDTFTGSVTRTTGENVGTYAITQGNLALSNNYTLSVVPATLTINSKVIVATVAAKSKTYGDVDPVLTYTFTPTLAFSDTFTGSVTRTIGENVGTYAITQGDLALTTNYALTVVPATLTINSKAIVAIAEATSKTYGDADPALTYTFNPSLAFADTFTGSVTRTTGENIGDYAIIQGSLALSPNYTLSVVPATLTINSKVIVATVAAKSKTYGDADPALTYTFNPILAFADTFTGSVTRTTGENVGAYAITQGDLALGNNYALTVVPATLTIHSKAIVATVAAKSKTYGDADPVLTYTFTPTLAFSDTFTGSLTRTTGENVGSYAITQGSLTLSGNYMLSYTNANLTIIPKALTITADNKSRLQGVANPTLTVNYTGFITGQNNSNALSIQPNITTTATVSSPVGNYPINASGAVAVNGNYAIAYVGGTLTVNAAAVISISLAASTLYENRAAGTLAGTLSSTSTDPAAIFTYTLVAGNGNADNARFTISGNQIVTAGSLDFEAQASYAIRVRSSTQFGVFAEQTFTINILDVNEAPTLNAVADQTVCYTAAVQNITLAGITAGPEAGQTVSMTITTNNPGLFRSLSVTKGNGTAGTFSYGISNGWSGTAIVTITVKDDGGTANGGNDTFTRTFNITVNPLPVVSIVSSVPSNSVSRGETLQLTANAPGATSYSWSNANGIVSGQNSANLTIKPTQTTTYTVTAFNATGCSESKQITIEVRNDFFAVKANNILTPNGDGANDTWIIANIDQYPNAEVKVFDRAGRVVFQRRGYDNSWNGSFNGTPLNEGAYMYVIDFGSGLFKAKGTVTILHNN